RGDEAAHDPLHRLDLGEGYGAASGEAEQIAQLGGGPVLDLGEVGVPVLLLTRTDGPLQGQDHAGTGDVVGTAPALLVEASRVFVAFPVVGVEGQYPLRQL